MKKDYIAKTSISIDVAAAEVWDALVNPDTIKQYMFGTEVDSNWVEGNPITWSGMWEGKPYKDQGVILKVVPFRFLQYTHFSPLAGLPDAPENYHTMKFEITKKEAFTFLSLSQDNNPTEKGQKHSESMWDAMLIGLKELLEKKNA
ncbi:MAG: ATPase [Fibrobacteres bacterium]|nr:ATPase [Fibrobacterota bacterium]